MCGISFAWSRCPSTLKKKKFNERFENLLARGPDSTRRYSLKIGNGAEEYHALLGFSRLAIQGTGPEAEQPFVQSNGNKLMVNGEIYNAKKLVAKELQVHSSDCLSVLKLLETMELVDVCRQLDGDFAIVYINILNKTIQLARDPYGVRPLYYARYENGSNAVASELKGLWGLGRMVTCMQVEPGTVLTIPLSQFAMTTQRWHQVPWLKNPALRCPIIARTSIFKVLKSAVKKRLACNAQVEIGACLSGGLDSSVIVALAVSYLARDRPGYRLKTYSIGMPGSPDIEAARKVASFLKTDHHEIFVSPDECLSAIPEVIRAIESYDITTVRASVGNYLVGKYIRENTPGVKVVLNGDGSDEILGGYKYMRAAPSDLAFEQETTRLLENIHCYDVLRSERCMAAHGLESRSPFLDRQFVALARSIPTVMLRPSESMIEKFLLRSVMLLALPLEIAMRPKEAFSDGISHPDSSWHEKTKAEAERLGFTEAQWYRYEFDKHYCVKGAETIPGPWMPQFVRGATDPSARTLVL